jgi:uncharacterized membrane protein
MNDSSTPAKIEHVEIPNPEPKHQVEFGHIRSQSFSGPLPPPELLGRYDSLCPGSADRIITVAEKESEHRRSIEQALVRSDIEQEVRDSHEARRGQVCALIITLAAIVAGSFTALHGHEIAGSIIGVGGIGGIVTSFLIGQVRRRQNGENRESPPAPPAPPLTQKKPNTNSGSNKRKTNRKNKA